MKFNRVFGVVLTAALALTVFASTAAAGTAPSSYGYLAGKAGRTEEAAPYAGMNYEGGEQGDTSAYSFQTGRIGKPWNMAE